MLQSELKHTLVVNRKAWYIRFYLWLWEADINEITICRLFWGYVFAVPGFLFRFGVFEPIGWVARQLDKRKKRKPPKKVDVTVSLPKPEPTSPSRMQHTLTWIEDAGTRAIMTGKAVWSVIGLEGKVAKVAARALVGGGLAIGVGSAVLLVYVAIANFGITVYVLAFVTAAAAIFGLIALLAFLGFFTAVVEKALLPSGRGIRTGALSFGAAMKAGYYAVKTNTCPKVEVRGDPDAR